MSTSTRDPFPSFSVIAAGLTPRRFREERMPGLFGHWRRSILAALGRSSCLSGWRARENQDLGLMLVEMGAYLADVISFYDALVAGESYLSTASLPGAARRLVSLVGYQPRPAVAGEALLAAHADGMRLVTLPSGSAFRSGSFLDETLGMQPPQLFELTAPATLEPRINRLAVTVAPSGTLTLPFQRLLVETAGCRLKAGDPLVLDFGEHQECCRVQEVHPTAARGSLELLLSRSVSPPSGASYADLRLLAPGSHARLWQAGALGDDTTRAIHNRTVVLESSLSLRPGEVLLFEMGHLLEARRAETVTSVRRVLLTSLESRISDSDNSVERTLVTPHIRVSVTSVTLDRKLNWSPDDVGRITLYHGLAPAARVVPPPPASVSQADSLSLPGLTEEPRIAAGPMLLSDAQGEGVSVRGSLGGGDRRIDLDMNPVWDRRLVPPLTLYGNVLHVSRGETVSAELLGVGDASQPSQTFKLAKKPLTYLSAATPSGLASSLSLKVGGVPWKEVPSFFGCSSSDRVYVVRHDDAGETYVTLGPAARPPSGSPILADYRFGAGAARPPAGSITQMARPVTGLRQVQNILPAFGGADAESPDRILATAPRSALLLGRAVSLADLEAAATTVAGVRGARASWRWDPAGLRPSALINYIGDSQVLPLVRTRLRELSEPDAAISVERSQPQPASLELHILADSGYDPSKVAARALLPLYDPPSDRGILRPERLGPDGVVFLSRVVEALLGVEGVRDLRWASFNGMPFVDGGRRPPAGRYWDFGEPGRSGFGIVISAVSA